jgi:hypothetical protein
MLVISVVTGSPLVQAGTRKGLVPFVPPGVAGFIRSASEIGTSGSLALFCVQHRLITGSSVPYRYSNMVALMASRVVATAIFTEEPRLDEVILMMKRLDFLLC